MQKVKLIDVARKCGFSTGSVSQILANPDDPRFRETTRKRVVEVANRLGYQPNRFAATLRKKQTHLIAMVLPWNTPEFMDAAERRVREGGYHFMVEFTHEPDPAAEIEALDRMLGWAVDGIIWAPFSSPSAYKDVARRLSTSRTKFALIHESMPFLPNADVARIDAVGGIETVIRHLKQQGFEDAIYLTAAHENPLRTRRREAFEAHATRAGMSPKVLRLKRGAPPKVPEIRAACRNLKKRTGIVCMAHQWAVDCLKAVRSLELPVPQQVGIVSMGDTLVGGYISFTEVTTPALTLLREPQTELAQSAAGMLIERIGASGEDVPEAREAVFAEELVIRESS